MIQALMHGIPSELHIQACLGDISTLMGDLLESPRVALVLCWLFSSLTSVIFLVLLVVGVG